MMHGKSGTDQNTITSALKFFGLLGEGDDPNAVNDTLKKLVSATEPEANKLLGELVRSRYPGQLKVSAENGTENQLHESFEADWGLTGETRRKAATFFLHAAKQAEIGVSPNFPKARANQGRTGRKSSTRKKNSSGGDGRSLNSDEGGTEGNTYTLTMKSGTVKVTVDVDFMMLMSDGTEREFVMDLVDSLKDFGSSGEETDQDDDGTEGSG